MKRIAAAEILVGLLGPDVVIALYDDDSSEALFPFYPDELSFTADELVGLTRDEALALRHQRDVAFLRS